MPGSIAACLRLDGFDPTRNRQIWKLALFGCVLQVLEQLLAKNSACDVSGHSSLNEGEWNLYPIEDDASHLEHQVIAQGQHERNIGCAKSAWGLLMDISPISRG
jgi:hypothetical protein